MVSLPGIGGSSLTQVGIALTALITSLIYADATAPGSAGSAPPSKNGLVVTEWCHIDLHIAYITDAPEGTANSFGMKPPIAPGAAARVDMTTTAINVGSPNTTTVLMLKEQMKEALHMSNFKLVHFDMDDKRESVRQVQMQDEHTLEKVCKGMMGSMLVVQKGAFHIDVKKPSPSMAPEAAKAA